MCGIHFYKILLEFFCSYSLHSLKNFVDSKEVISDFESLRHVSEENA